MRYLLFVLAMLFVTAAHGQAIVVSSCGTGAYPVGQLHQLTMNPAGYLCVSTTTMLGTAIREQGDQEAKPATQPPPGPPKPLTPPPEPAK